MVHALDLGPAWTFEAVERLELQTGRRFEFVGGMVFPRDLEPLGMAGASPEHDDLVVELLTQLGEQLLRGPHRGRCRPQTADARIAVRDPATKEYRYPDVSVVCGARAYLPGTTNVLVNPVALFEVLSPATTRTDVVVKLGEYTAIPSLEAYVIVSPDERRVVVHRRLPARAGWMEDVHTAGVVALPGLPASLDIDQLYAALA